MKLVLKPGEQIKVTLADSDGEFIIRYGKRCVSVTTDLPDSDGRSGVIYKESFGRFNDMDSLKL